MKTNCILFERTLNICLIVFISVMLAYICLAYKYLNIADKIHVDYSGDQLSNYKPLIIAKHFPGGDDE